MKIIGTLIPNFKLENGKIVFDEKKAEGKLDLSTRLKRKASKRVRVARKGAA